MSNHVAEAEACKKRNAALRQLLAATETLKKSVRWEEDHPEDGTASWQVDYATDGVENAANDLVAAVNLLPERELPIGWKKGIVAQKIMTEHDTTYGGCCEHHDETAREMK